MFYWKAMENYLILCQRLLQLNTNWLKVWKQLICCYPKPQQFCCYPHIIWMSHWHRQATEGAEFWISCKQLKILRKAGNLQLIQNLVPSVARQHQCDIGMIMSILHFFCPNVYYGTYWKRELKGWYKTSFLPSISRGIWWWWCNWSLN